MEIALNFAVRMELVDFDRLHGDGGGGAENGLNVGCPGNLGGGAAQADNDLAVVACARHMLQQLHGNMGGIDVRTWAPSWV